MLCAVRELIFCRRLPLTRVQTLPVTHCTHIQYKRTHTIHDSTTVRQVKVAGTMTAKEALFGPCGGEEGEGGGVGVGVEDTKNHGMQRSMSKGGSLA